MTLNSTLKTAALAFSLAATLSAADAGNTSPLVDAVKKGDVSRVHALVAGGASVNASQADGSTPLHWAAHRDHLGAADVLLNAGANPNATNDLGVTPLWLACENGSAAVVTRLLEAGARSDGVDARRRPLMMCARTGSVEAVTALVTRKADVNAREPLRDQTALMWAVAQRHADIVGVLLAHGADVNARSRFSRVVVNRANPNDIYHAVVGPVSLGGSTPLLFAARAGEVASARLLLRAGANANDLLADGTSALTVAAHSDQLAMVRLLLESGANPNIIGSGYTALHAAVLRGNLEMVRALVARGANIETRLRHGTPTLRGSHDYFLPDSLTGATPLWLAAKFVELDILRTLLDGGADPSSTLGDGTTSLMAAAGVGAQTRLFDRRDRAALLRDSDEPQARSVVEQLLARRVDVKAVNEAGDTALHGAAAMSYPALARNLVERGARLGARNKKGETPLAVATSDAVREVLRQLEATAVGDQLPRR